MALCAQSAANRFKYTLGPTNAWVAYSLPSGKLYDLSVYNASASMVYIHVFDKNSVPADGAYPAIVPIGLPAGQVGGYQYTGGRTFTNGITIAASTTPITTTNAGVSIIIDIAYGGSQ